jgi:hypothetical protein
VNIPRFSWTKKHIASLRRRTAAGESVSEIAAALGSIARTVRKKQIALGLVERRARKIWTAKERELVRQSYPDMKTSKIASHLGRTQEQVYAEAKKMGLKKSAAYLASPDACRLRRGGNIGEEYRFPKGHAPANKGTRRPGYAPGRSATTQFKKGERSGSAAQNWRPIGTILPDPGGYLRIKVREAPPGEAKGFGNMTVWPMLARHIWEQHKGPIPAGHKVVFRDGNRKRCEIENLEMISNGDLMKRNTIHNYPPELKNTIYLLGALKRKVREHAEKFNDRSAQPSV